MWFLHKIYTGQQSVKMEASKRAYTIQHQAGYRYYMDNSNGLGKIPMANFDTTLSDLTSNPNFIEPQPSF